MLSNIYEIRRLTVRLEDNVKNGDYLNFVENCETVRALIESAENQFRVENPHIVRRFEAKDSIDCHFTEINEIGFLYKPVSNRNIFEGSYIEIYANERTEQLKAANAYNEHNEFWMQHQTVYGNIYGSVPYEFIDPSSAAILQKLGWKEVSVKILDFGKSLERETIVEFCKERFENFIIVVENSTDSYLVLNYLIK